MHAVYISLFLTSEDEFQRTAQIEFITDSNSGEITYARTIPHKQSWKIQFCFHYNFDAPETSSSTFCWMLHSEFTKPLEKCLKHGCYAFLPLFFGLSMSLLKIEVKYFIPISMEELLLI